MAFFDTTWYVNFGNGTSTGYYAVAKRPQNAAVVAGQLVRQFTDPGVGVERIFICTLAGTTANTTDASWGTGHGQKTVDGTANWIECTGNAAINGDSANTLNWSQLKALGLPSLGFVIKRNNGVSYQIMTSISGTLATSEPAFSDTVGVTTLDGNFTWTSLGPVTNFTGGQAPHNRLANALASGWFVSGNTVYVGDNHAETQIGASGNVLSANSALMARIICHKHLGSYPPTSSDLATTATIADRSTPTGTITISLQGSFYFYGLTFIAGDGSATGVSLTLGPSTVTQVNSWYYFDACSFWMNTTSADATSAIQLGNAAAAAWQDITFNNTTIRFNAQGQSMRPIGQILWRNAGSILASGSIVPSFLFVNTSTLGQPFSVVLEGIDLSQINTSFYNKTAGAAIGSFFVKDCKFNSAMTITTMFNAGQMVQTSRSSAIAAPYVSSRTTYEAIETTETSIVRTGGFVDPTGQVQSRKIVTSANAQWLRPYKAEPYAVWNSVVGSSVTATVYGLARTVTLPNNDDVWLELQYLGSGASPLGSLVTTTKGHVWDSNTPLSSDSSTWLSLPAFSMWNPSDLLSMTLSNNNLTATGTTAPSGIRAYEGFSSGKYYWEITVNTWAQAATGVGFGLASAAFNAGGAFAGGAGLQKTTGNIIVNAVNSGSSLGARSAGDTFGIALDISNNLCWFRVAPSGNWNGSGTANPATGTGGVNISVITGTQFPIFLANGSGEVATANFGGSAFSGAVPSGFTSGWPAVWYPFKLTTSFTPNLPGYILGRVRAAKPNTTFYLDPKLTVS